jgi:hypothetical protein
MCLAELRSCAQHRGHASAQDALRAVTAQSGCALLPLFMLSFAQHAVLQA